LHASGGGRCAVTSAGSTRTWTIAGAVVLGGVALAANAWNWYDQGYDREFSHPAQDTRASYLFDIFTPIATAGFLALPGVLRRAGSTSVGEIPAWIPVPFLTFVTVGAAANALGHYHGVRVYSSAALHQRPE
jgi:hypothetical protein